MWRTPEELLEIGLRRSRVVMINEAHDGLKRCIRTRQIGQRILPTAHRAGVRHLAMEALSPFFVDEANRTRQLPEVKIGMGYLHQPDMRAFMQAALDLGWTLIPYEINFQEYPLNYPLSMEYTNFREEKQAKNLVQALQDLPSDTQLLVWCGNGHPTKVVVKEWLPMGYQFKQLSGIDPFVIDQTSTVKSFQCSPEQQQQSEQFLKQFASELVQATLEPVKQAIKDADLSPEAIDRILLVGGSTRIPAVQQAISAYFNGKAPDRSVNPDEAVALGASIQAGVLGGEVKDLLLLDVTPLSLGIETLGEVFTKIIERNTTLPTSKSQVFSTATDGQTSVEIHVLQGERAMAKDNKSLGKFELTGIPPAPRGVPQIEVSFEIDADGILKVAALDKGTGRAQSICITNTGGLTDNEVDRMRLEAEAYADEDGRRRQIAELTNRADNLFYSYEATLRDHSSLLDDVARADLEEKANELRAATHSPSIDVATFQGCIDALQAAIFAIGTNAYRDAEGSAEVDLGIPSEAFASVAATDEDDYDDATYDSDGELDATVTADYEAID